MLVLVCFGDLYCPGTCGKSTGMNSGSSFSQLAHFNVLICKMGKVIPSLSPSQCFSGDQIQIYVKNIKLSSYYLEGLLINVFLSP